MSIQTEVLVIGGGPGGYSAAFRAADLEKKVTIVESRKTLGGVCLNVGCIPSKTLLHLASQIQHNYEIEKFGIKYNEPEIEFEKIRAHKDSVVKNLTTGLDYLAQQRKVDIINGTASFITKNKIKVINKIKEYEINFQYCIIACGSKPIKLKQFPDDSRIWNSTDALALQTIPENLLIVGGGIIGIEMAFVFSAFGSTVTVVELMNQIIPGADKDVTRPLSKKLKKMGIKIHLNTKLENIACEPETLIASFGGKKQFFDNALISVGRVPNTDSLMIENTGIKPDKQGFIETDDTCCTQVSNIYAIGDITGQPMLAHKATHQGKVAAEVIAGLKTAFIANTIPSVVYTNPEIAWTGLTEKEAKEENIAYETGKFLWKANGRSLSEGNRDGFTKIIFDSETKRVIGAGIVGPHAGELIGEATLAIEMGSDVDDLAHTIHPHPTLTETIGLAAEVADGSIIEM